MFVINSDSAVIKKILKDAEKTIGTEINNLNNEIAETNKLKVNENDEDKRKQLESEAETLLSKKKSIIDEYSKNVSAINELIDIALLEYGLLNGEAMSKFIKRLYKSLEK